MLNPNKFIVYANELSTFNYYFLNKDDLNMT